MLHIISHSDDKQRIINTDDSVHTFLSSDRNNRITLIIPNQHNKYSGIILRLTIEEILDVYDGYSTKKERIKYKFNVPLVRNIKKEDIIDNKLDINNRTFKENYRLADKVICGKDFTFDRWITAAECIIDVKEVLYYDIFNC